MVGARCACETGREQSLERKIDWSDKLLPDSKMPGVPCYKILC